MKHRLWIAVSASIVAALGSIASAQLAISSRLDTGMPWQMTVCEADLIIVAAVTVPPESKKATPGDIPGLPGSQPQEFKVKVEKVLGGSAKGDMEGKDLTISAGMVPGRLWVSQAGERYVMFLDKPAEGSETWSVIPQPRGIVRADDAIIKHISEISDIDKWDWGKECDGLRVLAVPRYTGPRGEGATLSVFTAIQNVSKEPIVLNAFPVDRCLTLKATWDGTPVGARPTTSVPRSMGDFDPATQSMTLKPGAVAWIGQWGKQSPQSGFMVDVPAGDCEVRMVYRTSRDAQLPTGEKLWKGTAESAPAKVTITRPE